MTYTRHSDAVWYGIREDHLAGYSFARVAQHYGVPETTIRDRARREGWSKADQPAPTMLSTIDAEWADSENTEPMRPPVAVIADAYRLADVAMRRGRLTEAQRLLGIAKAFERLNRRDSLTIALDRHWAAEEQLFLDAPDHDLHAYPPDSPVSPDASEPPLPARGESLPRTGSGVARSAGGVHAPEGAAVQAEPVSPDSLVSPADLGPAESRPAETASTEHHHLPRPGLRLTESPFPLGFRHDHPPARAPELSPLAIAGARDLVRSQTATFHGGPVAHPASAAYPPEPT